MKKKEEAESLIAEISDTFSTRWGITKGSTIEYTLVGSTEKYKVKCKDIKKNSETEQASSKTEQ